MLQTNLIIVHSLWAQTQLEKCLQEQVYELSILRNLTFCYDAILLSVIQCALCLSAKFQCGN